MQEEKKAAAAITRPPPSASQAGARRGKNINYTAKTLYRFLGMSVQETEQKLQFAPVFISFLLKMWFLRLLFFLPLQKYIHLGKHCRTSCSTKGSIFFGLIHRVISHLDTIKLC